MSRIVVPSRRCPADAGPPELRERLRSGAGVLLLLAGAGVLLGIVTAEALHPVPLDRGVNTVSDLGAMRPENVARQPSAVLVALAGYPLLLGTPMVRALGEGGVERWIVYAVVLWLVVLGTSPARRPA